MSKPADIPQDVWDAAASVWLEALRDCTPDAAAIIARAILAERERCVLVARNHAAGRTSQAANARSAGQKKEARDFESMAMSADDVAAALLKGGE